VIKIIIVVVLAGGADLRGAEGGEAGTVRHQRD